jgi:aspartyl-tRNA(Asn)/glutamyl-tRNA(Gln) amidotransferase subunit C
MHELTEEELHKLSRLCRIECSDTEKKKFAASLSNVLGYIEQLNEIDTEGVKPCYTVLEAIENVLREDEVKEVMNRIDLLANAPAHVSGMVKVPPVIKF